MPDLRSIFEAYAEPAGKAKRRSHLLLKAGFLTFTQFLTRPLQ